MKFCQVCNDYVKLNEYITHGTTLCISPHDTCCTDDREIHVYKLCKSLLFHLRFYILSWTLKDRQLRTHCIPKTDSYIIHTQSLY